MSMFCPGGKRYYLKKWFDDYNILRLVKFYRWMLFLLSSKVYMNNNDSEVKSIRFVRILGIKFLNGDYSQAKKMLIQGGLMVAPSAPGLATILKDIKYYIAVMNSDFAITDSSLMVNIWRLINFKKLTILSGQRFIYEFIRDKELKLSGNLFLVDPNSEESKSNRKFLGKYNILVEPSMQYIAPFYSSSNIVDYDLLNILKDLKPKFILINLGGGVQERLGYFLKNNLSYMPSIICTGAAIAFFTGHQGRTPVWFDKIYLGWLYRCISNPKIFIRRYFKALKLVPLMLFSNKIENNK